MTLDKPELHPDLHFLLNERRPPLFLGIRKKWLPKLGRNVCRRDMLPNRKRQTHILETESRNNDTIRFDYRLKVLVGKFHRTLLTDDEICILSKTTCQPFPEKVHIAEKEEE